MKCFLCFNSRSSSFKNPDVVSSAKRFVLNSVIPIFISVIKLLLLTLMVSNFMDKINRYDDIGQPCLTPLYLKKKLDA